MRQEAPRSVLLRIRPPSSPAYRIDGALGATAIAKPFRGSGSGGAPAGGYMTARATFPDDDAAILLNGRSRSVSAAKITFASWGWTAISRAGDGPFVAT